MADLLARIRALNGLVSRHVVEPFAGGAGAALSLLLREETPRVWLNDADPAVHDFWWALTRRTDDFLEMIRSVPLTIEEWRRQTETYRSVERIDRFSRGFATFYLNRCNRSGIVMNGGPIGGIAQEGAWRLDARFNREALVRRCGRVAEYRTRIDITGLDGVRLLGSCDTPSHFLFVDPPYYHKGKTVYMNTLSPQDHSDLAARLRSLKHAEWVVTYDDCPQIRALYDGWATVRPFSLDYSAFARRRGREVLIAPNSMRLPETQTSLAIEWKSPPSSPGSAGQLGDSPSSVV